MPFLEVTVTRGSSFSVLTSCARRLLRLHRTESSQSSRPGIRWGSSVLFRLYSKGRWYSLEPNGSLGPESGSVHRISRPLFRAMARMHMGVPEAMRTMTSWNIAASKNWRTVSSCNRCAGLKNVMSSPSSLIAAMKYCLATMPQRDFKASSMRCRDLRHHGTFRLAMPRGLHLPSAVAVGGFEGQLDSAHCRLHQASTGVRLASRKAAWLGRKLVSRCEKRVVHRTLQPNVLYGSFAGEDTCLDHESQP